MLNSHVNRDAIGEYLRTFHKGVSKSVTAQDLQYQFNLSRRHLVNVIKKLRHAGFAICSGNDGYYYAKSLEDFKKCVNELHYEDIKIRKSIKTLQEEMEVFAE